MQRDLVERAMHGDREAFSRLVRTSRPRLNGVAWLILRDADRSKDALQEAIIAAWKGCPHCGIPTRGTPGFDGSTPLEGAGSFMARGVILASGADRQHHVAARPRAGCTVTTTSFDGLRRLAT